MKRLILMRHAKSDWSDPMTTDHERGLNARGIASAKALGRWLEEHKLMPDLVLCSDATRTRETLALLNLSSAEKAFSRELYLAEPDVMLRLVMQQTADCMMIVAHNPGIAMLAASLPSDEPDHDEFDTYPTGATLVVEFDIGTWREIALNTGSLAHFTVPRDIMR
ncbi:SixA phosphatase family protein [Sulfitobacter guttiformis]|uniref:Phosphohistidine phosphatase n=1 Tax=Sulfitobacter guttiformis TaxID=74349 RepID=A0A420DQC3_9RHOB|nr:histidine phosphatase family protein [Sulfitobacter guttiformis]KIN73832.1 Phosphoglycerate mutase [Sulfitobacter guttiformis KCTC 32187]RKE96465.1 phosphohistidine phosphatase [Sulfitobacter guttiformis]